MIDETAPVLIEIATASRATRAPAGPFIEMALGMALSQLDDD